MGLSKTHLIHYFNLTPMRETQTAIPDHDRGIEELVSAISYLRSTDCDLRPTCQIVCQSAKPPFPFSSILNFFLTFFTLRKWDWTASAMCSARLRVSSMLGLAEEGSGVRFSERRKHSTAL